MHRARALAIALALTAATACTSPTTSVPYAEPSPVPAHIEIQYEGHFDGEVFTLTQVGGVVTDSNGAVVSTIGASPEALLATLDAGQFGSTTSATGSEYVAMEQVASSSARRTNGVASGATWDTTRCGPVPNTGTCVRIRMRNLYDTGAITRAHFELTSLTPGSPTTSVYVPQPAVGNETAPPDTTFGVGGASHGLWRYGAVRRSSPTGAGPDVAWVFLGSTSGTFRFDFMGRVRADLVDPSIRVDVASGTTDLPPTYAGGTAADGPASGEVALSSDGRYAAFSSSATNLVAGTTAAVSRVYRADLQTGTIDLVSTGSNLATPETCASSEPSISSDGAVVAFSSTCALEIADTNGVSDVYVRRLSGSVGTILASRARTGASISAPSNDPDLAPSGNWVVFVSTGTLSGPRPAGRTIRDIYRRDVSSLSASTLNIYPVTWYYSSGVGYVWLDADSRDPQVGESSGSTVIAFETDATNAVGGDANGTTDIVAYAMGATAQYAGTRTAISTTVAGANMDGPSTNPAVSDNGAFVMFASTATNAFSTSGTAHVYHRSRLSASTLRLLDRTPNGTVSVGGADQPEFAGTRYVGFRSAAADLTTAGLSGSQIYALDLSATETAFARAFATSLDDSMTAVASNAGIPTFSADDRYAAFVADPALVGSSPAACAYRVPLLDIRGQ